MIYNKFNVSISTELYFPASCIMINKPVIPRMELDYRITSLGGSGWESIQRKTVLSFCYFSVTGIQEFTLCTLHKN